MTGHNSEDYRFNLNRLHLAHDAVGDGEEFYDEVVPAPEPPKRTCSHDGPCMVGWDLLGAEVCTIPIPDPYLRSHDA